MGTGYCRLPLSTYAIVAVGAFILYYAFHSIRREAAIRRLGGRPARVLFSGPFKATLHVFGLIKASRQNRLGEFIRAEYDQGPPETRNVFEARPTPFSRDIETREPTHIKAVLASQFSDFGKGPDFHRLWSPFLGDSIFTTDGKLWQNSRALIRPMFMTDRISDLYIFERCISKLLSHIPPSGATVEISDLFFRMTLDATTDFLFGADVNSLDNPNGDFTRAFNEVLPHQLKIWMMRKLSPFDRLFSRKEYHDHIKTIEDFIAPYIQRTLAIPPEDLEKLTKSDSSFTFLHNLALFTRDPKVIRDQLMAVLLAGRDTTAAALSWTFYELAAYPEKVERLREEVMEVVGKYNTPTYGDLKNMKYLRYTLQEILRLHPAVPANQRTALVDTILPGVNGHPDIGVCKGDTISYAPMELHARRDLYPEPSEKFADPAVFSPERWYHWQPRPWEYIPFNGGPRICPGQNFAMTEMSYCIVRILQKFDRIEYRGDWSAQRDQTSIISRPAFGVPIAFFEAADE